MFSAIKASYLRAVIKVPNTVGDSMS